MGHAGLILHREPKKLEALRADCDLPRVRLPWSLMEPATGASGKVYPLPGGAAPSCRAAMTTPSGVQTFGWSVGKIY